MIQNGGSVRLANIRRVAQTPEVEPSELVGFQQIKA
jgi:hypothetical protein